MNETGKSVPDFSQIRLTVTWPELISFVGKKQISMQSFTSLNVRFAITNKIQID